MIDVTCCFANNLKKEITNEHSKIRIANEFDSAISDGYIRFLAALTNENDVVIAETLFEAKKKYESAKIKIEVLIQRELLMTNKDNNANSGEYIKKCMVNFDSIIVYDENINTQFYSINHYLLYYSTRVILLYNDENISENKDEKEIDDFFVAHMLYKDVKKLIL